jgi:hypothetical protein
MTEEERNKEIEWLKGSIQRSVARNYGKIKWLIMLSVLPLAFGAYLLFDIHDNGYEGASLFFTIGAGLLLFGLFEIIYGRKMARAETPQELLAIYDRKWILESVLLLAFIVGLVLLDNSTLVSKTCKVLAIVLFLIANWLAMNQKLRLWVAMMLLIAESALLYFSGLDLLEGIGFLIVMLSVFKGEKLFGPGLGGEDGDEDAESKQEIRQLRALLKESEGNA